MFKSTFVFLKKKFGIDQAILWSTIYKGFSFIKAPFTIFFIVNYLTPQNQGLWYTFNSLGALTVFAELGFASIITQFVSHEFARLYEENSIIKGDQYCLDRLIGLIRFSVKFYIVVILIAIIILVVIGHFYFRSESGLIFLAWFFFSIVGGCGLFVGLLQSIYQGLDKVKEMQINAFISIVVCSICNWIMLTLHWNIWALVVGNFIGLLISTILLYSIAPEFWNQVLTHRSQSKHNFIKETVPLQGKYALSWISGYFIFYLYVPATYKYLGSEIAGQLGITMSVITVIMGISGNWVSTKVPKFNILVSTKNLSELNSLFKKSFIQGFIVQLILSVGFILGLFIFGLIFPVLKERFLNINLIILLLFAQFPMLIINSLATYLRSHKEEPFVWLSVINAILMVFALFIVLANYKMNLFLWTINIIYWLLLLPLAIYIFIKTKHNFKTKYY